MYKKLMEQKIITNKNDYYDGIFIDNEMDNELNNLIDEYDFLIKNNYEDEAQYKYRLAYYKFIKDKIKLKGDIAIILTCMHLNKLIYNVKYNEKYETILNKIDNYNVHK